MTNPDPYAMSPDAGIEEACDCGGAWHAMKQHCIDWPCPGCNRICPPEPGTEDDNHPSEPRPDPYATSPAETSAVLAGIAATGFTAWAISDAWPTWAIVLLMIGSLLIIHAAYTAIRRASRGRRIRLRYQGWGWSRPAIVLTDTPRPTCPDCHGEGGWTEYVQDGPNPEDGERLDVLCDCWTTWSLTLLALPRHLADARNRRGARAGYSQEPPF